MKVQRVRIASPIGSTFDGREGVVVGSFANAYMVRLDGVAVALPFARSECDRLLHFRAVPSGTEAGRRSTTTRIKGGAALL